MKYRAFILSGLLMLAGCGNAEQKQADSVPFEADYAAYGQILSTHLKGDRVDYRQLRQDRKRLDGFIDQLATLKADEYDKMSRPEKMSLLINAYNGITLRSIIDAYPVKSIKDIDGVWKKKKWKIAGKNLTLDEIEHSILRPQFKDARVHFAVNCASVGCPPLASTPYNPQSLDSLLDHMTAGFINNESRNRISVEDRTIYTSEIFTWFADDFLLKYSDRANNSYLSDKESAVLNFMRLYANEENTKKLATVDKWKFVYEPYDWTLNDIVK